MSAGRRPMSPPLPLPERRAVRLEDVAPVNHLGDIVDTGDLESQLADQGAEPAEQRLPCNKYRCWALAEVFERIDAATQHARDALEPRPGLVALIDAGGGGAGVRDSDSTGAVAQVSPASTPDAAHVTSRCKQLVYERDAGEPAVRPAHLVSRSTTPADADSVAESQDTATPEPKQCETDMTNPGIRLNRGKGGELWFDDDFESGNLSTAHRIDLSHEPETVAAARHRVLAEASLAGAAPLPVDQEYALRMRSDLNTTGNTQWFYFAVRGAKRGETVRFRVENHTKPDSLFNYGLRPQVLSKRLVEQAQATAESYDGDGDDTSAMDDPPAACLTAASHPADDAPAPGTGWYHGGFDCCYFQSQESYFRPRGKSRKRQLYEASFSYTFPFDDDVVFFAYCRPYTYTRLQRLLGSLESSKQTKRVVYRRKLCSTLAGNRCDMLSIGSAITSPADHLRRKGAFLSARVHPGETNASWMMAGVLRFITSNAPAAAVLRRHCVTRIVPMLNPDGVIIGNYRCSLAGQDLNRRWRRPRSELHPTIHNTKLSLRRLVSSRPVALFMDLHGHSRRFNIFTYGCERVAGRGSDPASRLKQRVFPHLLWRASPAEPIHTETEIVSYPPSLFDEDLVHAAKQTSLPSQPASRLSGAKSPDSDDSGAVLVGACDRPARFKFSECKFGVSSGKSGTGRVVGWREVGIANSLTLEASFMGSGDSQMIDRRWAREKGWRRHLQASTKPWFTASSPAETTQEPASTRAIAGLGSVSAMHALIASNGITAHSLRSTTSKAAVAAEEEQQEEAAASSIEARSAATLAVLVSCPDHVRHVAESSTSSRATTAVHGPADQVAIDTVALPDRTTWSPLMPPVGLALPLFDGSAGRAQFFAASDLERQGRDIVLGLTRYLGLQDEVRAEVEAVHLAMRGGGDDASEGGSESGVVDSDGDDAVVDRLDEEQDEDDDGDSDVDDTTDNDDEDEDDDDNEDEDDDHRGSDATDADAIVALAQTKQLAAQRQDCGPVEGDISQCGSQPASRSQTSTTTSDVGVDYTQISGKHGPVNSSTSEATDTPTSQLGEATEHADQANGSVSLVLGALSASAATKPESGRILRSKRKPADASKGRRRRRRAGSKRSSKKTASTKSSTAGGSLNPDMDNEAAKLLTGGDGGADDLLGEMMASMMGGSTSSTSPGSALASLLSVGAGADDIGSDSDPSGDNFTEKEASRLSLVRELVVARDEDVAMRSRGGARGDAIAVARTAAKAHWLESALGAGLPTAQQAERDVEANGEGDADSQSQTATTSSLQVEWDLADGATRRARRKRLAQAGKQSQRVTSTVSRDGSGVASAIARLQGTMDDDEVEARRQDWATVKATRRRARSRGQGLKRLLKPTMGMRLAKKAEAELRKHTKHVRHHSPASSGSAASSEPAPRISWVEKARSGMKLFKQRAARSRQAVSRMQTLSHVGSPSSSSTSASASLVVGARARGSYAAATSSSVQSLLPPKGKVQSMIVTQGSFRAVPAALPASRSHSPQPDSETLCDTSLSGLRQASAALQAFNSGLGSAPHLPGGVATSSTGFLHRIGSGRSVGAMGPTSPVLVMPPSHILGTLPTQGPGWGTGRHKPSFQPKQQQQQQQWQSQVMASPVLAAIATPAPAMPAQRLSFDSVYRNENMTSSVETGELGRGIESSVSHHQHRGVERHIVSPATDHTDMPDDIEERLLPARELGIEMDSFAPSGFAGLYATSEHGDGGRARHAVEHGRARHAVEHGRERHAVEHGRARYASYPRSSPVQAKPWEVNGSSASAASGTPWLGADDDAMNDAADTSHLRQHSSHDGHLATASNTAAARRTASDSRSLHRSQDKMQGNWALPTGQREGARRHSRERDRATRLTPSVSMPSLPAASGTTAVLASNETRRHRHQLQQQRKQQQQASGSRKGRGSSLAHHGDSLHREVHRTRPSAGTELRRASRLGPAHDSAGVAWEGVRGDYSSHSRRGAGRQASRQQGHGEPGRSAAPGSMAAAVGAKHWKSDNDVISIMTPERPSGGPVTSTPSGRLVSAGSATLGRFTTRSRAASPLQLFGRVRASSKA